MPTFTYRAYAQDGTLIKGALDAGSSEEAAVILSRKGLMPIKVEAGSTGMKWWQRDLSLSGRSKGLSDGESLTFTSTLSSLLNAHLPLSKALLLCQEQSSSPKLKEILAAARQKTENGDLLSVALEVSPIPVSERLIAMIRLGEASNSLGSVLAAYTTSLGEEIENGRELRGALVYPCILIATSALVIALILFHLIPTLKPVFESAGAPLPQALKWLDGIGLAFSTGWPFFLAASFAFLGGAIAFARSSERREKLRFSLPVVGVYSRQKAALSFCQSLSLMLTNGETLSGALRATEGSTASPAIKAMSADLRKQMENGHTFIAAIAAQSILPKQTKAILASGDTSGQLALVLQAHIGSLQKELSAKVKKATQLVTPVLTLFIGLTVGGILVTTITAILDLNDIAF